MNRGRTGHGRSVTGLRHPCLCHPGGGWHRPEDAWLLRSDAHSLAGTRLAIFAGMLPVAPKKILRDTLIGFGIGLVLMLGIQYGAPSLLGSPPAAATSTQ